ncbi:MAG: DNRLRE domain-containing protein [Candidatus Doudnabacteria bacterium]
MKWRVILFIVFFWLVAGKIEAAQVTINATADTYVNSYAPTQNFGSVGTLEVRSRDISRSSFLQFNLSHFIPLDATVTRAYLKLYLFDNFCYTNATAPMNIRIYRVSGRWSEQSITYQSQPDASTVDGASLTLPLNSDAGYKTWDVTNIVKGWIDNQYLNYGLRTYYYSVNNCQATFYARETGEGMKPQLVVEYTPPPDRTPPQIREVSAEVTAATATIRWKTYNDPSSSTVAYRRPGAQLWPIQSAGGLTVDHSVTLTNLQPQTLYQYTVKSRDAAGNEAVSAVLEFTTAEAEDLTAPDISNVNVNHLSSRAVEIIWSSQEEATGEVRYSTDRQRVSIATQAGLKTNHTVRLEPLLPATTYYFVINSEDARGNRTVREEDQFTTQADAAAGEEDGEEQDEEEDYNPLSIYNIILDVLSPTSMRFKWWSTIDGTSWVFASADADDATSIEDYEFVAGRNDGVDMHEVVLNNLAPATTYSYRVLTRSADDQADLSELKTFRTDAQAAPEAAGEQPEALPPLPAEPDSTPQDQVPEQITDPAVIEEIRHQAQEAEKKESLEPAIAEEKESSEPAVKESENLEDEDQKPAGLGSKFLLILSRFWVWIILGGVFFLALLGVLLYLLLRKKKGGENREANPIASQPSGAVPSQTVAEQTVSQTPQPQKPKKS